MKDYAVGSTAWFRDYSGVGSGEVVAIIEKDFDRKRIVCVKTRSEFKSLEVGSSFLHHTRHDAILALANEKQQQAARLLSEAAGLFKDAGGMTLEVEEEAVA